MKKLEKQESDTGLNPSSKRNLSSPESKPKRIEPRKPLEQTTNPSQSTSGSNQIGSKTTQELSENGAPSGSETTRPKKQKSAMPVPKLPQDTKRADQALKRLKVKDRDLAEAPPITALIKTTVKGGLKVALEAMRFATDDPEIKTFLRFYGKIPVGDVDRLPWEAISIAAKVNPKHLVGAIQIAVQAYCANKSRFIAVSNHPATMRARVKYAKMAGGERDRTQHDIMVGALPSPKGTTIISNAIFRGGGGSVNAKDKDSDEPETTPAMYENSDGFDDLFPSPSEVQEKLIPIRQRLLEG
jgi:hypothetical protein